MSDRSVPCVQGDCTQRSPWTRYSTNASFRKKRVQSQETRSLREGKLSAFTHIPTAKHIREFINTFTSKGYRFLSTDVHKMCQCSRSLPRHPPRITPTGWVYTATKAILFKRLGINLSTNACK